LLFAAPPAFTSDDNPTAQERLDKIANTPMTHSALLEGAEVGAAMGGTFMRLVWDTDVADHVMLDVVDADRAIPDFQWKRLVAVTFWDQLDSPVEYSEQAVWRHLERHEPGVILHGLYKGTGDKLGQHAAVGGPPGHRAVRAPGRRAGRHRDRGEGVDGGVRAERAADAGVAEEAWTARPGEA